MLGQRISLQNWQSTIRHFVRALSSHREYGNVERWTGRETSDLVYDDVDCKLLSDLGRLSIGDQVEDQVPEWLHDSTEPLEWFFEVKTTIEQCSRPFFMSQAQYSRVSGLYNVIDEC